MPLQVLQSSPDPAKGVGPPSEPKVAVPLSASSQNDSPTAKLILFLVVIGILRCVAARTIPLLASEAYYWLWGRYLAAGYFDHPPMAGVMSAIFFGWVNGSELAARSGPIVLGLSTTLVVYALMRDLFSNDRLALKTAILFSLIPVFDLGGMLIQPDNSLAFFSALTWLFFWRASKGNGQLGYWIATGIAAGLALLSKFHAWVLLPPLYLFLFISPNHRKLARTPGPWLAMALSLLVLSPNLIWNAQHDWINYLYQFHRSKLGDSKFDLVNTLVLIGGSAITLSPLISVAMIWSVWRGWRAWRSTRESQLLFLLCAGVPLPLFLFILSSRVEISLHWPTTGFAAVFLLMMVLMERGELFGPRLQRAMWGTCIGITALAHLIPYILLGLPSDWVSPYRPDDLSTRRFKSEFLGWKELGREARETLDAMKSKGPAVIMTPDFHRASLLAFYSERPRDCFPLSKKGQHNFQFWREERGGLAGYDALVIIGDPDPDAGYPNMDKKYEEHLEYLRPLFEHVEPAPSLVIYEDGSTEKLLGPTPARKPLREFLLFHCTGFKGLLSKQQN